MWLQRTRSVTALFAGILWCIVACPHAAAFFADQCASKRIDRDLNELRYDNMAADVACLPAGEERDLFQGVLDNKMNHVPNSVQLLNPLASAHDLTRSRLALVLATLADDSVKLFEYGKASRYYDRLLRDYSDQLSPEVRQDDSNDDSVLSLLKKAPKQTISAHRLVDLPISREPSGVYRVVLTVHGVTRDWILDTGADHSVVSESFAKELGLKFSKKTAATPGFGGVSNKIHVAILDRLDIGSATVRNTVMLVVPDANLTVSRKGHGYVIPALLGYPIYQALGKVRFTANRHFLAGPNLEEAGQSSPLYMDKLNVLVLAKVHEQQRVFQLDSGSNETVLYSTYYRDFPMDFADHRSASTLQGSAVGGTVTSPVEYIDDAEMTIGGREATLHHIPVQVDPTQDPSNRYEGNIGCDLLDSFESATLDFTNSSFYLGPPISRRTPVTEVVP